MSIIEGYSASILIGVALGLIGGGGSILTVPVLVYLFRVDTVLATAYSLFIVGTTSAVGSISYFHKGLVNMKTAIGFGLPSIVAVFLTRAFVVPIIPSTLFSIGNFTLSKSMLLMLLFALLMIFASYGMIRKKHNAVEENSAKQPFNYPLFLLEGVLVGTLTGLVGAGGGFLIVPALIMLGKLEMKEAVGTSLVIIAANSLFGFLGKSRETPIDWIFLSTITAFAILGIFLGMTLSRRIEGTKLRPAFGWFVLFTGIYIIVKETLMK